MTGTSLDHGVTISKAMINNLSVAQDLSGLGSTRVVRLGVPVRRCLDKPDGSMATGTQDGGVSGGATKPGQFRLLTTGKDQRRRISNV